MSILDDAIREHLELKRAHGADEAELKKLEDEAFGPPGRPEEPDPFAEAPTQYMTTEGAEAAEEGGRRINVADLQEPPPPEPVEQREEPQVESAAAVEPEADAAPPAPAEDPAQTAPPAEEAPAMEHEIVSEPPEGERHAIAEQPTELFDVEAEMGADDAPAAEVPSPSDEEIAAAELSEPKLAPAEPATEIHASRAEAPGEPAAEEDEEDEEFWSDQRLSEELDQALEAPITDESELPPLTDEHEVPPPAAESPAPTAEPAAVYEDAATEGEHDEEDERPQADYDPDTGHEDVLEDTPDFLEDAPEDDELWFEQKPPKDFDFDD
jgi:hypothetical protein